MTAKIFSCAIIGLTATKVEVEVDIGSQMPGITVVGLPDKAIDESRERVRSALKNAGFPFPRTRITINLAPADLKKEGPAYDLAIAIGILVADTIITPHCAQTLFLGELSLDARVRPVNGVLPSAIFARDAGFQRIIVPIENAKEAALVRGIEVIGVERLTDVTAFLEKKISLQPTPYPEHETYTLPPCAIDMASIKGQEHVKRAFEIAAAGSHNVLLSGPPGTGKTYLARAFPGILPILSEEEALEVTKIYSVAGLLPRNTPLVRVRTFRNPHHSASAVSLVGGGQYPRPGEISLAHRGVLFLDEFPEFSRGFLENLRQPLEDGCVTISRAQGTLTFPARFILIASQNPCPCGYAGDLQKICVCTPTQIQRYQKKVSGPILDRIDLIIWVPRLEIEKLARTTLGESSQSIRERVQQARNRQEQRFVGTPVLCNSEMSSRMVEECTILTSNARQLLLRATEQFHLSVRGYMRVIKVAQTIADLAGNDTIEETYIAEALQFRHNE